MRIKLQFTPLFAEDESKGRWKEPATHLYNTTAQVSILRCAPSNFACPPLNTHFTSDE